MKAPSSPRRSSDLPLYVVAAVAYIAAGVAVPALLFSWVEGAIALLLVVWVLPALWERFR